MTVCEKINNGDEANGTYAPDGYAMVHWHTGLSQACTRSMTYLDRTIRSRACSSRCDFPSGRYRPLASRTGPFGRENSTASVHIIEMGRKPSSILTTLHY